MSSVDFVANNLFDGKKLRMLTLVDCFTRESLVTHVGQSLKCEDVVRVVDAIAVRRGAPQSIKTDNGSEFTSKAMDNWAYEHKVALDFSRPGKPTDIAMVESFNGRLREECLNEHSFLSLEDAERKITAWRQHYNVSRPHSALGWSHRSSSRADGGLGQHRRTQRSRKSLLLIVSEMGTGSVLRAPLITLRLQPHTQFPLIYGVQLCRSAVPLPVFNTRACALAFIH